ncbi:hypothetical protein [Bradyrhizobium sp. dw_411]|uniref:hypothetical protein n=1 Tax=Bradyrhizobium sp. dw_411 TaxID=2720082 RepID=UPI001BCAE02C|nr:hypothetical protein [Bradyrhizobium sp. dw_411]
MRKTVLTILGALLITGSASQMATASNYHVHKAHRAPAAASEQFRSANNSTDDSARSFCGQEPGNPNDEQTDYQHWSAFRSGGGWDDRNSCQ